MKYLNYLYFISLFVLFSCDPCEKAECPNPFTNRELQWVPYSEGDKLNMVEMNSSSTTTYNISYAKNGKSTISDDSSPYCESSCFYMFNVRVRGEFPNEENEFTFEMVKTMNGFDFNIFFGSVCYYFLGTGSNKDRIFNLEETVHLDSLSINGQYIKDVYKYTTYPMQETVAETYMHRGLGLVKIKFRNGQDFELVEHIRVDE